MNRRRNPKKQDDTTALAQVAAALARQAGVAPSEFRYVKTSYFDGRQWTTHCEWQRRAGDDWIAVAWTELEIV